MKTFSELLLEIKGDKIDRDTIINALSIVVSDWLEYRAEELFSKLYRLDVLEKDIKAALGKQDIPKEIATLIYERQFQKILSRKENPASEAPDDLKW